MNFSNDFKIIWWFIVLVFLTMLGFSRFDSGVFNSFDTYLLVAWFILILLPIISEVSIFGVSVKKEIESVKGELKSYIATIKTDIQNQLNFHPVINNFNTPVPADKKEYENKVKIELKEEAEQSAKKPTGLLSISPSKEEIKKSVNEKYQERIEKVLKIEKLVADYFLALHPKKYKAQMKLEDDDSGKKIIVDGLIIRKDDQGIQEIVEIKFITSKSFENFYFVANRFIAKLFKIGIRIPVKFVVVSEQMDTDGAGLIKIQLDRLNNNRSVNPRLPSVSGVFFKFENEELIEVRV